MRCPKCRNSSLKEARVKSVGVRIDHCPQCKGVWFDAQELETALDVASKELRLPAKARESESMYCPRCLSPLYHFEYPQTLVQVDMCKDCRGLWLDGGEFIEIKTVRQSLKRRGKLDEYAMSGGIKGGLLRFIDVAIDELKLW
jgi:Zn-finger nucleic acid-binding protein